MNHNNKMIKAIEPLFQKVAEVKKEYEDKRAKGEEFNLFRVLKIERKEVILHSRLIAHLLDPKGDHGQESAFLKVFLKKLPNGANKLLEDQIKNLIVKTDHWIGSINEDKTEGGCVDIVLYENNLSAPRIIIENKIDALDQNSQLLRYDKYGKGSNALLLYLEVLQKV